MFLRNADIGYETTGFQNPNIIRISLCRILCMFPLTVLNMIIVRIELQARDGRKRRQSDVSLSGSSV
jgi:hypothetical protein